MFLIFVIVTTISLAQHIFFLKKLSAFSIPLHFQTVPKELSDRSPKEEHTPQQFLSV